MKKYCLLGSKQDYRKSSEWRIKPSNLLDIKNLMLLEIPDLDFPKFTVLDFLRYRMTAQI